LLAVALGTYLIGEPLQTFAKTMDKWTIKTPNPICRLFLKTVFVALCLTDFIDWRYIHSWLVFSTQLVKCCSHGRRNCTCGLLLLYLLSGLHPLPPSETKCSVYTDSVWVWGLGEGGWVVL
jgi:hypothetical protein